MNKKTITITLFVIVIIIALLGLFQWRAANVVLQLNETQYKVGETLSSMITIVIENGDSLEATSPILISLNKGSEVKAVETITLKEFIQSSNNPVQPLIKNGKEYFETPGEYAINSQQVIPYTFQEPGEYSLFMSSIKLNLATNQKIIIY